MGREELARRLTASGKLRVEAILESGPMSAHVEAELSRDMEELVVHIHDDGVAFLATFDVPDVLTAMWRMNERARALHVRN